MTQQTLKHPPSSEHLGPLPGPSRGARAFAKCLGWLLLLTALGLIPPVFQMYFALSALAHAEASALAFSALALALLGLVVLVGGKHFPALCAIIFGVTLMLWLELGIRGLVINFEPDLKAEAIWIEDSLDLSNTLFRGNAFTQFTGRPGRIHYSDTDATSDGIAYNRHGFIGPDWPYAKPAGVLRVACLGSSTTASGYPIILEETLNTRADGTSRFEVLNFGMDYWCSAHSVVNYMLNVRAFAPDFVVFHHGWNEFEAVASRQRITPDYSHAYHSFSPQRPPAWLRIPLRLSLILRLGISQFGSLYWTDLQSALFQSQTTEPAFVEHPERWASFKRNVEALIALTTAEGVHLVLTTQPRSTDPMAKYADYAATIDMANSIIRSMTAGHPNVSLIDLDALMTGQNHLFKDIAHVTPLGRRFKAEAIADAIR